MLTSLSIRNVVLIEKLDIDFSHDLSVFTGETGAGKSILLDALAFVLGARADTKLIRHQAENMSVSASFNLSLAHPAHVLLTGQGLIPNGMVILRRVLSKDGKGKAFVNDEPVGVAFLKTLGEILVEIHGQFASHRLLNPAVHLDVLDSYGGLNSQITDCRRAYELWQYKQADRERVEHSLIQAQQEEEFIRSSVSELQKLNPQMDEEETLTKQRVRLMNAEKIIEQGKLAYDILADDGDGVLTKLNGVYRPLEKLNQLTDNQFRDVFDLVDGAQKGLDAALAHLERQMEGCERADDLTDIDDRLFALKDLARKHRVKIDELSDLLKSFEKKLADLDVGDEAVVKLRQEEENARLNYVKAAGVLSKKRQKTAQELDKLVNAELPDLKLGKAKFLTELMALPESEWGAYGMDKAVFLVSTNAGVPPSPVHKIASGGELNRFMLALKVILARAENIPTIIFDEVDTGISGATADAVGNRLAKLGETHQVLVVTHSPQVAAYGKTHWTVSKKETKGVVITSVEPLDEQGRLAEVARMLSGAEVTESAKQAAKELLGKSCGKKMSKI